VKKKKPVSSKQRYEILALIKTGSSRIAERTSVKTQETELTQSVDSLISPRHKLNRTNSMDLPQRFYMDDEDDDKEDADDQYVSSNNGVARDDEDSDSSFSSEGNSDHEHEHDFDDVDRIEREKKEYEEKSLKEDATLMALRQKNKELEENMKKMEERMKQLLAQKRSLSKTNIDDVDDEYYPKKDKPEDTMTKLDKLLNLVENPDTLDQLLNKHATEKQTPFMSKIFLEQQRVDQQKVLKNDDQWAKQKRLERERELRSVSSSTGDVRSQWESRASNLGRKSVS